MVIIAGLILLGGGVSWGGDRRRELRELEEKTGVDLPRHEVYGYVDGRASYQTMWVSQVEWPEITQGYWYLLDESSEVTGNGDEPGKAQNDANLFKRASFNVTVVVYDTETRTLYYYELDT